MKILFILFVMSALFANAQLTGGSVERRQTKESTTEDEDIITDLYGRKYKVKHLKIRDNYNSLSLLTGFGSLGSVYNNSIFGVTIKAESKWFIGSNNLIYKPGIQAVWYRFGAYIGEVSSLNVAPLNVGMTNLIAINNEMGVEFNASFGPLFLYNFNDTYDDYTGCFLFNPEVIYRFKALYTGVDIAISSEFTVVSFVIGWSPTKKLKRIK